VRGQFRTYSGKLELDPDDFTRSHLEGEVEAASIDTGVPDRDKHLRTNDFLDAPDHPTIHFKSGRIEAAGEDRYLVHGPLTIRGVTRPVALEVEYRGTGKNPWGQTVAAFSAQATINRKDWGVNWNATLETGGFLVGDKVKLELDVEAIEEQVQPAPGPSRAAG